jgi:hypothetical protein
MGPDEGVRAGEGKEPGAGLAAPVKPCVPAGAPGRGLSVAHCASIPAGPSAGNWAEIMAR